MIQKSINRNQPFFTVLPGEYELGLRNPLKGFQDEIGHPYSTLDLARISWSSIENTSEDGVDRIIQMSDALWPIHPDSNMKVVPRVNLHWATSADDAEAEHTYYWPEDLEAGDYTSPEFQERLVTLIEKLGKAWDNDPRVAYIEMGLIGKWGEHHSPEIPPHIQTLMGDAFERAFPNTPVMFRYPEDFTAYPSFGLHWDSFGHPEEWDFTVPYLESPAWRDRWKSLPMGGETAFDWGTPLGANPTDAVINNHEHIISLIERFHTNHLSWLSNYDWDNPDAARNASEIQKAFGYRFILESVSYSASVKPGDRLGLAFTVRNDGNTPLYGDWPVELAFHDPETRELVWSKILPNTKTQTWLPDKTVRIRKRVKIPKSLATGEYVLSMSILDPAGNQPAVRFATDRYWHGGRHPLGKIGVNTTVENPDLDASEFDDPATDESLFYVAEPELTLSESAISIEVPADSESTYTLALGNTGNRPLAWRLVEQPSNLEPLSILLVDDDEGDPQVQQEYIEALSELGHDVTVFEVKTPTGNGPSVKKMMKNDLVVWFSGDQYSEAELTAGPNDRDERRLQRYLDRGGKLLLSSQDYAYDRRDEITGFMRDDLGVDVIWSDDAFKTRQLYGTTVLAGLDNLDLPPTDGLVFHDTLFPRSGRPILADADTGRAQAMATEDAAYLAFPWESLYRHNTDDGLRVMDSIIDLLLPPDVPWLQVDDMHDGIDVNDSTDVTLTLDTTGYGSGDRLDATLEIWHNDPNQAPRSVPIAVEVI